MVLTKSLKTAVTDRHSTWTQWLKGVLEREGSPYAPFYHSGLETQIQPTQNDDLLDRYAAEWPIVGNVRPVRTVFSAGGVPIGSNDGIVDYHPNLIDCAGTSWWNWRTKKTEACFFDFDFGHGGKALDEAGIAKVDDWARSLPYVMNVTSRSGKGRHWLLRPAHPLDAPTREAHKNNCRRFKALIDKDLGFDVGKFVCQFGSIQYVYSSRKVTHEQFCSVE